jgi:hypothetical protein
VAPAKSAKRIQKAASNPVSPPVATRVIARAFGSNPVSKGVDSGVKKTTAAAPKRSVPASRMMAEASSAESQESSPHEPLPQGSVPKVAARPEHEASL